MAICSHHHCYHHPTAPTEPPCSPGDRLMPGRQKMTLSPVTKAPPSSLLAASPSTSAESSNTYIEVGGGDAAADQAAAKRRLVQNVSWNASTLATDSIHSQRDNVSGNVSLTEPSAPSTPAVTPAAADALALPSEESSRPLKKRRTALSPPPPLADGGPGDLSCSASVDGPQSHSVANLTAQEQSDEDSVEPRLNAMEVMHGQWAGGGARLQQSAPPGRPTSPSFPGHHSVGCMHPAGDLEYAHSISTQKPAVRLSEAGTTRWGGKVKHRLGDSTVELFYLSALVPTDIAEQMPPTLFVTELAPRSALKLHAEHRVLRCRLDFLTDRQLHKLRMLAGLKLAAVSQLQHCAIAMVPYLDAQRHLRIIGVLLNSSR